MSKRPLTFEQARGTKTYHLPFGKGEQPQVTLVVRRMPDGSFHAGISVCAKGDHFTRHAGRTRAFHRLNGCPIAQPDGMRLHGELAALMKRINDHRPNTVPEKVKWDLMEVCTFLNESFDRLESNRLAKERDEAIQFHSRDVNIEIELDTPTEEGYEAVGC